MTILLFVCTGNICRSPFAEGLARRRLEADGWSDVQVRSAGTHALTGHPCPREAQQVAGEFGVDLTGHFARDLTLDILKAADLVVTMSLEHEEAILLLDPALSQEKVVGLAAFAPGPNRPDSIPDPFGGLRWNYRVSYCLIERCVERLLSAVPRAINGSS